MSMEEDEIVNKRKIRFRTPARTVHISDNKIEDLPWTDKEPPVSSVRNGQDRSLFSFLQVELTRGYVLDHEEERFTARREKVYSFMKIPREVERFMFYGFMQCTDSFLFVYTFLPMRVLLALWGLVTRPFSKCFGLGDRRNRHILAPAEICDLLKAVILVICTTFLFFVDINMFYHVIKSQSVIKLYIFYNMLEVGDRLFSAFGQDTIDALFWTATEPRDRKREHFGVIPHLIFASIYVLLHSILVLFQAATLNVAMNTSNKALLTIMMSNNFVELKGSVFKKFDKNNLFQVSCSDVRERFHLVVLLSVVALQTMREYAWKSDRFLVLVPDCFTVLLAEMLVDWIKHAFITRFNELHLDVYREYTTSLAYDVFQTRQKYAFSDHSDLVARRMGFIPLPLGVVMIRVLAGAINIDDLPAVILVFLFYLFLVSFKILNSLIILGTACDLIRQHEQDKVTDYSVSAGSSKRSTISTATSPLKPPIVEQPLHRPPSIYGNGFSSPDLGSSAIFANSTVDLKNVSLNDEMLKVDGEDIKLETALDQNDIVTRSYPSINRKEFDEELAGEELKRAESEPSLIICTDGDDTVK